MPLDLFQQLAVSPASVETYSLARTDRRAMEGRWILISWQGGDYDTTFGGKGQPGVRRR